MEYNNTLWLHEPWRGLASGCTKHCQSRIDKRRVELTAIKNRNQMAAWRQHVLRLDDARIGARNSRWRFSMQAPAGYVKETPPLFRHPILALNALSPPFAKVTTRPKPLELVEVARTPRGKTSIIILRRDPFRAASSHHIMQLPIVVERSQRLHWNVVFRQQFRDVELRIGPVNLLGYDALTGQAGHFWKLHERHRTRRVWQPAFWGLFDFRDIIHLGVGLVFCSQRVPAHWRSVKQ